MRVGQKQPLGQVRSENVVRRREALVLVLFAGGFHSGRHMCSFNRLNLWPQKLEIPESCRLLMVFMRRLALAKVVFNTKRRSKEQRDCGSTTRYFNLGLESQ